MPGKNIGAFPNLQEYVLLENLICKLDYVTYYIPQKGLQDICLQEPATVAG